MNVNPDSVTYVGGAYHVDEIILHVDGVSLAKQAHYESEVLNDGLEWPLTDVSFTIENNHIKTLSYTQSPITLDRESGMIVISDKSSTQTITFSNFGTTTFDIPEEITAMLE